MLGTLSCSICNSTETKAFFIPVGVLVDPDVHGLPEVLVVLVEDGDEAEALGDAVAARQQGYQQTQVAAACNGGIMTIWATSINA